MTSSLPAKLREALNALPRDLLDHCKRTGEVAQRLAERFGYDPAKALIAAQVHDIVRAMSKRRLLEAARRFGIVPSEVEERLPVLLHGPVGAEMLRRDYGLTDEEILSAVACHTTGKPGMGLLDKILFLADKVEPEKVHFRPELEEVRVLAESDLDRAVLKLLDLQLTHLIKRGSLIHPAMVKARNDILVRLQAEG